jgi:hypothetical protein
VDQQTLNQSRQGVRTRDVQRAEGQDDQIYYEKDGDPVKESADEEMIREKFQFPARHAIDGGCRDRNEIVQENAEYPRGNASVKGLPSQQPAGDGTRNAPPHSDECGSKIETTGDEATGEDWED